MKLRLNDAPMYKHRRRAVFFFALAILWIPYAISIWLAYPSWWFAALAAVMCGIGVTVPSALLGIHFLNRSRDEAAKLQPMLGVVLPKES